MDSYNVIVAPKALSQLEEYINYIQYTLLNEQAAKAVYEDALASLSDLTSTAGSLKLCNNLPLRKRGYRIKHFAKHRYVFLYLIENKNVYVEAVYHELQDFENVFINE